VRNSVDHGLESADVRKQRGKPERGTVWVTIAQSDSSVRVEVKDDGGGVNFSRLRDVLASSVSNVASLDDADLIPYLFAHGVTTRRNVSSISGRGVGLDVVAREVNLLGGQVRIDSNPGIGTSVLLVVPVNLHGEEVVPISAGRYRCAVPTHAVHSVVLLDEIIRTSDGARIRLPRESRSEIVALFSLGAVLGDGGPSKVGDAALVLYHAGGLFPQRGRL
jgi:two-component system, chemotaxis family, sensor kinase CheA